MKIAIVRGDFASPWEIQNFRPLSKKHKITLFTGLYPVTDLSAINWLEIIKLPSPVDLNFGNISPIKMSFLNRIFTDAHVLFGLEEKLKGFDIVHCAETYYSYTQQCIRAKKLGLINKIVTTVWENIAFNNESLAGRKEFKSNSFANIDEFVAVTNESRRVLIKEGCPRRKISVINPGIDLATFYPKKINKYKQLVKNGSIKLLFVGRLVPDKGILEVLRIFTKLRKTFKNIELVVVGSGPLNDRISGSGIKFLGTIPYNDMPKIYSLCDVFVHYPVGSNTWHEQYGMVLIEAMACGLPVVSLDVGSVNEVVGKGGLVVGSNDFSSTLQKLVVDNKYRVIVKKQALRFARYNYSTDQYANKIGELYEKTLKN